MYESLLTDCKFVRHSNAVAAGQTTITPSAGVDCLGYEGVVFVVEFGAIVSTAVTSINVQDSSDDGVLDAYADVAGTAVTVADTDDNKVFLIDCKPLRRYAKLIVTRGTADATLEGITAILYGPRQRGAVLNTVASGVAAVVDGASYTSADLGSSVGGGKSVTLNARGTP